MSTELAPFVFDGHEVRITFVDDDLLFTFMYELPAKDGGLPCQ